MSLLEITVLLPIVAALAVALGSPARFTALAAAALTALATLLLALRFNLSLEGGFQFATSHPLLSVPGFPQLQLAFGLDGISLVLVILTALVLLAALWAAPAEDKISGGPRLYYASCLLIGGGALGAFCSTDLFFLYAFHELALIPTFLMIGLHGRGEKRVRTAWTITVYLGVGSLVLLVGLLLAVFQLGGHSFDIADLLTRARGPEGIPAEWQGPVYFLLLVGFGVLVSLFPFHSWAPPAYAEAPTPVAMLHAGVLKKFGLYGFLRLAEPLAPEGAEKLLPLVLVLLLGNILYIGLVTIAQKDLNRMLAHSSVMHMGYAFLGIVSGTQLGMIGAVLLMFAHGVSIALLFGLSGALRDRFGSLELARFGGLATVLPGMGLLFGFAVFASVGLPGFANFAAEVMIFFGAFEDFNGTVGWLQWACILALWGVVISAVYALRAYRQIFKGPLVKDLPETSGLAWKEKAPALLLLASLMVVGFVPEVLVKFLRPAVEGLFLTAAG